MAYSDFTLAKLLDQFNLTIKEKSGLFATRAALPPSELLQTILTENVDLAVAMSTEKARSELIIAPILLEVRRQCDRGVSLFSGVEFNVDPSQGLAGFCDFLLSLSPEQLLVRAPVVTIVEAKNENLRAGLAQCIAEMVAAQSFNQKHQEPIATVYGAVTIGTIWQFLQLEGQMISVDLTEYYIRDIDRILGILLAALNQGNSQN
ncbi:MAG: hypothetical protein F6J87_09360 [Spirulina sp. SIO3F2]|nr:hypothetical protein [Spirulina sp. SIO3F2]